MMVPSRCVKSEYMKRFKEPKWEACGPCYQELLRYRLSRRLLEQAHRPWFWDGWEKESNLSNGGGSGCSSSPLGTSNSSVAQPREEEAAGGPAAGMEVLSGELGLSRISAPGKEEASSAAEPVRGPEEDDQKKSEGKAEVQKDRRKPAEKEIPSSTGHQQRQPLSQNNASGGQGESKGAKSPQRTETALGIKHPFALYGWGEKQTDTGSQKTHNVCASASVNEIHESALRAKNRRQMEKRKLPQKRIHTTEVERMWRTKSSGQDNPWMTEYMRCYSARTR